VDSVDTDLENPYEESSEEEAPKPKAPKRYVSHAIELPAFLFSSSHINHLKLIPIPLSQAKASAGDGRRNRCGYRIDPRPQRRNACSRTAAFGTANDHDSDMGSEADVTVRPGAMMIPKARSLKVY
jgi:hypothetical protein